MAIHRVAEEKYVKTNPCENEQVDDAEREEPSREDGIVGHNENFSPMKTEQIDSDRGKMSKRTFKSVHSTIISLRKDDDEGCSVGHDVSPKLDDTPDENSQPSEDNRAKEDSLGSLHEDIKCQERDEDDKKGIHDKTRKTPLSCSLDEGLDSAEKTNKQPMEEELSPLAGNDSDVIDIANDENLSGGSCSDTCVTDTENSDDDPSVAGETTMHQRKKRSGCQGPRPKDTVG